jgi:hypothetical protein
MTARLSKPPVSCIGCERRIVCALPLRSRLVCAGGLRMASFHST